MSTAAVILAAGLGKRMKSALPKVLHPILGDASLLWVLRALPEEVEHAVLVLHHGKAAVEADLERWAAEGSLPCSVSTVDQGEPLGTGHAVRAAEAELERLGADRVLILCGDVPLIRRETLRALANGPAALLAMDLEQPGSYGRVLTHADGTLAGMVEYKDASEAQRAVRLANGGAYSLPWSQLKPALHGLSNDNAQGEYYLTDAVVAVGQSVPVKVETCDPEELLGMNSRLDQAQLQAIARDRVNCAWMEEGVSFLDPASTLVGPRVALAPDVLLEPGVRLEGCVSVGQGTRIGQGSVIREAEIGPAALIRPYCVVQLSKVGAGVQLGPFAHLREGSVLEEKVHVGNFVETKKATLRAGAKANHLSYLGDAEVGERTNIGAGFISCNYDGVHKHRTTIGRDCFVGSDVQLVAPVTLGDGVLIAAGSTITKDVPDDALAMSRAPQVTREGLGKRFLKRK
nr:bifunctional UDP-N-acetylglucosamine diphosphorylase/glucosamine-1-phosphate N-acetyltransferase GlmU [uncultured Holophaga sp.]